jgi:hypothetical protein
MKHHFFVKPAPPYADPPRKELGALSPKQQQTVERRKAAVYQHMPELVPIIRELHQAGMIDGWRGVGEVVLFNGNPSTGSGRTDNKKGESHGNT